MTNDSTDPSVDVWRSATLPLVRQLTGLEDGLALKVARRGAAPGGGGEVHLNVPLAGRPSAWSTRVRRAARAPLWVAACLQAPPSAAGRGAGAGLPRGWEGPAAADARAWVPLLRLAHARGARLLPCVAALLAAAEGRAATGAQAW